VPALAYLIETLTNLYLLVFLLRFLLQVARADFYNPISRFVVRVTDPVVVPARRIIPTWRGLDLPTMVVLIVLQTIVTVLLLALANLRVPIDQLIWLVVFRLVSMTIWMYTICVLVHVILSWISQAGYNPVAMLLHQIVEPILRPARRIIPPIGGLDFSPLITLILLQAISIALATSIAPLVVAPVLVGLIR